MEPGLLVVKYGIEDSARRLINPMRVHKHIVPPQLKLRSEHGGVSGIGAQEESRSVVGIAQISAIGDEFRVADPQL